MKMRAATVSLSLAITLGLGGPDAATAQDGGGPFGSSPAAAFSGEEILVTYVLDWSGPSPLQAIRTVRLELVGIEADRLLGRYRGQLMVIDRRSIRGMKRRIGTKPASAPAMVVGSAAGFAAGFLLGSLAHQADPYGVNDRSAVDDGLVAGVLIGAPLGALAAWAVSRSRPIYEDVGLVVVRPRVAVAPDGQVDFAFSIPTG